MSKQPKRQTCKQKKEQFKTPANYYASKRHKAAVQLNQEINHVAESIQKSTTDLALEFSKTVDDIFGIWFSMD